MKSLVLWWKKIFFTDVESTKSKVIRLIVIKGHSGEGKCVKSENEDYHDKNARHAF